MRFFVWMMICCAALFGARDAQAHRLRIFASVEAGAISGYAYFVGGARAKGATIVFRNAQSEELHRMQADGRGAFAWTPPKPQEIRITVDAGDGHIGSLTLQAKRFSAEATGMAEHALQSPSANHAPASIELAELEKRIEARIEAAVARQMRPLLEAQEAAQSRMRFSDIMAGIGIIIGMSGAALWVMSSGKRS